MQHGAPSCHRTSLVFEADLVRSMCLQTQRPQFQTCSSLLFHDSAIDFLVRVNMDGERK
ncbi:hypothetical protein GOODEAATRI_032296, partial [Goodea atripinnis]